MNKVGTSCLATIHQCQLLTSICLIAESASGLLGAMNMQFFIHEAFMYFPSFRRVVIWFVQHNERTSLSKELYTSAENICPPLLYPKVTTMSNLIKNNKTDRISSEIMPTIFFCKFLVEGGNSLKKNKSQKWNVYYLPFLLLNTVTNIWVLLSIMYLRYTHFVDSSFVPNSTV